MDNLEESPWLLDRHHLAVCLLQSQPQREGTELRAELTIVCVQEGPAPSLWLPPNAGLSSQGQ